MTRVRVFSAVLLSALGASLVGIGATPAMAVDGDPIAAAAQALRAGDRLYVAPDADGLIDDSSLADVRSRVSATNPPIFVAVLPDVSRSNSGPAVTALARSVGQRGTYVIASNNGLYAGSNAPGFSGGEAGRIVASAAAGAERTASGRGQALSTAVDNLERAGSSTGTGGFPSSDPSTTNPVSSSSGSSGVGIFLIAALALIGGGLFFASRSSKRRRQRETEAAFADVRVAAEEDVTRFGEDITGLDLDVDAPNVNDDTRRDYAHALNAYDQSKAALDKARTPEDLQAVTVALEDGRFAMESVRARIEGRPVPERRPPCFFNPQHGPSARDVQWSPPGGAARNVPACAADAERVESGFEPESRQVVVDGERRPYWDAGPTYGPWAGGYYSGYGGMGNAFGGMLPGILVGTMLGGAMGGFGGHGGDTYIDNSTNYGDGGGGDFGGFGGGGDFGGGDFGGGDFGGGDFGGGDFGGGDMGGGGGGDW